MKKISGSNVYFKKILPFMWFAFIGFFILTTIQSGVAGKSGGMILIVPLCMLVFGFFLFNRMVWDLVDEVYDLGDELLFRKNGMEQRVKLRDIINVDCSQMTSPERITITLRVAGQLGKELVFNPPARLFNFTRNPLVIELIERVDRARNS